MIVNLCIVNLLFLFLIKGYVVLWQFYEQIDIIVFFKIANVNLQNKVILFASLVISEWSKYLTFDCVIPKIISVHFVHTLHYISIILQETLYVIFLSQYLFIYQYLYKLLLLIFINKLNCNLMWERLMIEIDGNITSYFSINLFITRIFIYIHVYLSITI